MKQESTNNETGPIPFPPVIMDDGYFKKTWLEKYGEALKTLIPIRFAKENQDTTALPTNGLGLFSFVSLRWMDKMMWKASRKGVQKDELRTMNNCDGVTSNSQRISRLWNKEVERHGKKASLAKTVWLFSRARLIVAGILMGLTCLFQFVGPAWVLKYLLDFIGNADQPMWIGILWVAALSGVQLIKICTCSGMFVIGSHTGIRAQGAMQMIIYEKVLRIKLGSDKLAAEIFNYFTNDIERIDSMMQQSMFIVGVPVMCTLSIVYCYLVMGPWSLLGNVIVLLYYPIMGVVAKKTGSLRIQSVGLTDSRISLMTQIINSIKLIKMYAWESRFTERIQEIRKKEEKVLMGAAFLQSMSLTFPLIVLILAPMVSFIGHVLCGGNLTAPVAFSIMTVFPSLQIALNTLPLAVKAISEGLVSCRRIQVMLLANDATVPNNLGNPNRNNVVTMVGANLTWGGTSTSDMNLKKFRHKKVKNYPSIDTCAEINVSNDQYTSETSVCDSNEECSSTPNIDDTVINSNEIHCICQPTKQLQQQPSFNNYLSDLPVAVSDINLQIRKGQLIGVCGNVGSGKSTLLAGISGEVIITKGRVNVEGSIALATQRAWIFNATVRENIIFGLPFNEERYKMVVDVCCLETDFKLMTNGDQTEIGEKGANLSGGQKQRVNLARAVYSDRDVYLLDDIMSAVDVNVAKYIFQNCIRNALFGKTVLMVTHAMHLLEQCDSILLMKDGKISERGTHTELIELNGGYSQMFYTDKEQRGKKDETKEEAVEKTKSEKLEADDENDANVGKMIKDEVDNNTKLTWKTIAFFCRSSGGYFVSFLAIFTIVLFSLANILNSVWLQRWLDEGDGYTVAESNLTTTLFRWELEYNNTIRSKHSNVTLNPDLKMYVAIYGLCGILLIICGIIKSFTVIKVILTGAKTLHNDMYLKVMRSPMYFFDTTPVGRIIGRFSRDMDELDGLIPYMTDFVAQTLMLISFRFILVGVMYLKFFIIVVIVFVIYIAMDAYLIKGIRETKRMDNLLRPPVLVHISTTIQGLPVIRTFKKEQMFIDKFKRLVEEHLSANILFQLSSKWFAFRIDTISWLTITATGAMVLASKGSVSPSTAGLVLSQIFQICSILAIITRWKSELDAKFISIERITQYCKTLKEEAPAEIQDKRPPKEWPSEGAISFRDVRMRYRPDMPLVLHGLTVDIQGGQSVGIIGRTGAGKSSIVGTLIRLVEIDSGAIIIDGIDISKIGLKDLRSKIGVIPQEPILFQGTIRWNLDPFGYCSDEQIWDALDKTHLKKKILKEPKQLETMLSAEGSSFSIGEKQLFCLARAILKNNKVLLLDEATASVDVETDKLIQETIRKSFAGSTVMTIAHRLNTIADYDKILALDAGKVIEFDTPANLLKRDSLFSSMMKSMAQKDAH